MYLSNYVFYVAVDWQTTSADSFFLRFGHGSSPKMLVGTVAEHLRRPTHSWKGQYKIRNLALHFEFLILLTTDQSSGKRFENVGYEWCKFRYLLQHRMWIWRMTSPLLKPSTSSTWSSKACKFDSWNELASFTMQVDLKHILLIWFFVVLMCMRVLDDRLILGCLSTNTCNWSLYKSNPWRVPTNLL